MPSTGDRNTRRTEKEETPAPRKYDADVRFYHVNERSENMERHITLAVRRANGAIEYGASIMRHPADRPCAWCRKARKSHNETAYGRLKKRPIFISEKEFTRTREKYRQKVERRWRMVHDLVDPPEWEKRKMDMTAFVQALRSQIHAHGVGGSTKKGEMD